MRYAVVTEQGKPQYVAWCAVETDAPEGAHAVPDEITDVAILSNHVWNGEWVQRPVGVSSHRVLNAEGEWYDPRNIADVRAAQWAAMKEARYAAEYSPLTVDGMEFDADSASQSKIQGAIQLALLAPDGWTVNWTLRTNTTVTLSKAQILGIGVSLGSRTQEVYAHGRTVRLAIEAATTIEDVQAVAW